MTDSLVPRLLSSFRPNKLQKAGNETITQLNFIVRSLTLHQLTISHVILHPTASFDYESLLQDIEFPPITTAISVDITILDDTVVEATEEFFVFVTTSAPRVFIETDETTVVIADADDGK